MLVDKCVTILNKSFGLGLNFDKTYIVDYLCVAPTLPGVVPQGYIIVRELLKEDREVRGDRRQSVVVCQEGSVEG